MTIRAATRWRSNAEMIADVVALGYLSEADSVLDMTYGRGLWWTKWNSMAHLTGVMRDPVAEFNYELGDAWISDQFALHFGDYTNLPAHWDATFDVAVFDPPYVSMGGRKTSTVPEFMDRYGMADAAKSPEDLHAYNVRGLAEARRVVRPGGFVMTKCCPYISSGQYKPGDLWMAAAAMELGLSIHDRLIHVTHGGPQPGGRRQVHARNNYSVLWVFQRPKERRTR